MRRALLALLLLPACANSPIGQEPGFTPIQASPETAAMFDPAPLPQDLPPEAFYDTASASLWEGGRGSLLGDDRAMARGDILTVVIEIDDSAEISNASDRAREGSQTMGVGSLFGVPEALEGDLMGGASLGTAVDVSSSSEFSGDGSVRRAEQLELRVAATVTNVLPNGILEIAGSQEVRVNFELRELLVTGFVRPADVSRQNEVTYDKIAQARISYGGRGQITQMQQPRVGQQALDYALPF
jgi:flagellar L-ring protein precursor FlgH